MVHCKVFHIARQLCTLFGKPETFLGIEEKLNGKYQAKQGQKYEPSTFPILTIKPGNTQNVLLFPSFAFVFIIYWDCSFLLNVQVVEIKSQHLNKLHPMVQ